jgi:TPR repeat protein
LGLMFQEGRGVAQNKDEAMRYFEALLNQGD